MNQDRKLIWGWAIYDCANSAFTITVMAGFFSIFFKQYLSAGVDSNFSNTILGFWNSIGSLFIALAAPILESIADRKFMKKNF